MSHSRLIALSSAGLFAALLTGCDDYSDAALIKKEISVNEQEFTLVDTPRERFRYQTRPAAPAAGSEAAPSGGSSNPGLTYDTPEGWEEKAGSSMRDVNFVFGENGEGSCYLARLPGAGGGLAPNVNRWIGQFGGKSLSEEDINALPKLDLFGSPATLVTVTGPFSPGMGSTETFENYSLRGLILTSPAGAVFVKMTGPKELVDANADKFDEFVASVDVKLN